MVLQIALPSNDLPRFYGFLMEKDQDKNIPAAARMMHSRELFGNDKLVLIEHEGAVYRLMITRQGKLILNK
jgi:hemin uptake protein HemP